MKKILIVLMAALMSFGAVSTSSVYGSVKQAQHLKKDGTPDKRYKENENKAKLTKSGKPDMRYKSNNPNAGKKKKM